MVDSRDWVRCRNCTWKIVDDLYLDFRSCTSVTLRICVLVLYTHRVLLFLGLSAVSGCGSARGDSMEDGGSSTTTLLVSLRERERVFYTAGRLPARLPQVRSVIYCTSLFMPKYLRYFRVRAWSVGHAGTGKRHGSVRRLDGLVLMSTRSHLLLRC